MSVKSVNSKIEITNRRNQRTARNKKIVELIQKGYSYRKLAKMFGLTYQGICAVKHKCLPDFKFLHDYDMPAGPLTFVPHPDALKRIAVCLLRHSVVEFMLGHISKEELDMVGRNLGLSGLVGVCRRVYEREVKYKEKEVKGDVESKLPRL